MAEQAGDFLKNWQATARESWDAWLRGVQQQAPSAPPPLAGADDLFARGMAGAKSYLEWLQTAAMTGQPASPSGWPEQLRQMFAGALGGSTPSFQSPFANAMPGGPLPWQAIWQAAQPAVPPLPAGAEPVAAFGCTREQQLQQQALAAAMIECMEASARYQELIRKAHAQGAALMQERLARRAEAGQPLESVKALYDLWVDAAEEAYAEQALSDEFREAFGAMSNAQMRLRRLQQQQVEQYCRELGMPTRSEVDSLGRRLQEVRREARARGTADEIVALREEVARLKHRLAAAEASTSVVAAKKPVRAASAPAKKAAKAPSSRRKATTTPRRRASTASRRP